MDVKLGMRNTIKDKTTLSTSRTRTKPCMRCQYGILDTPVEGKLNCFEAGPSNIKLLSKEEVEEMTFCDKMVPWAKMEMDHKEVKDSEIKLVERILGNR